MNYFLIWQSADHIGGNKLPLLGQILQYVLHLKESSPVTTLLKNHLSDAVEEVLLILSRTGIKTVSKQNAIMWLKKQYEKWQQLCKNKMHSSDPGRKREIFAEALSKLWDIGAPDAIQTIQKRKILLKERKAKDIFFYEDQRNTRKGAIEGKDALYKRSIQKHQERFARSIVVT